MEEKNKRWGFLDSTTDILDVPGQVAAGMFRITITGKTKVHLENHRGILEYGGQCMRVNCGRVIAKITGFDLEVRRISASEMLIVGSIDGVTLE